MANLATARKFWDEKAIENPFWYISSFGPYSGRDEAEFWRSGIEIWKDLKRVSGFTPNATETVVEIGCGVGRLTRAMASEVARIHAFDISRNMIELAQKLAPDSVQFHWTSGMSLRPLPDRTADLTLAYCVLQHLPDLQALSAYLHEMVRVTKESGIVAFTLSPKRPATMLLPLARMKAALREIGGGAPGPKGTFRKEWIGIRPSRATVRRLCPIHLRDASLDDERVMFWGTVT